MIPYAETPRLILRALRRDELPRLQALIGAWNIARWLTVMPFPFTDADAEDFWADIAPHDATPSPQFIALALKDGDLLVGGIGLNPPRTPDPEPGEVELGFWLAHDRWGQGLMTEAVRAVLPLAFARAEIDSLSATALVDNAASQSVLRKAGFRHCGTGPRPYAVLRGTGEASFWRLTRADYEGRGA